MPLAEGGDPAHACQIASMRRLLGRFSVIGIVDPHQPESLARLEELADQGVEAVRLSPGGQLGIW